MSAAVEQQQRCGRVWWLGFYPSSNDIHWWLTHRRIDCNGLGPVAEPTAGCISVDQLIRPLRTLASAIPKPLKGESDSSSPLRRAWTGALAVSGLEQDLATLLGSLLLPADLTTALSAVTPDEGASDPTETVVIATGPSLAAVPFELLTVDPSRGLRLIETARLRGGLSAAVGLGARNPHGCKDGVIRVVDPGPSRTSGLSRGGVYASGVPEPIYQGLGGHPDERWFDVTKPGDVLLNELELGRPITREELSVALRSDPVPSRMLFVGHAVSGTPGAPSSAGLVLSDPASGGPYRPFTAADWIRRPDLWPSPPRVALMSCMSNDTHLHEQMGLVQAAMHAGARLVTSTRWVLPADQHRAEAPSATTDLALAVDAAHQGTDPVGDLRSWQLSRLREWRRDPHIGTAPLIWAAPVTYQRASV